ncbi:M81 family metallopeptidase [Maridesulfovibrio frigidus]|uniref:M81 family metallopeptidase n=1 Tax=Maridesulfovibrio frigidus TaxID=340956 RepID=UPI0004E25E6A|nr:M81 family metallopeptidase [Maridesulfovibrio frigidus]
MSFNVMTAEMSHETNSFSRHRTGRRAFMARYVLMGDAAIAERGAENTSLAGFLDVGREHDWQITHVLSAAAGPSGKIRRKAFDWLCEPILCSIENHQYDGLLLGLHGAMGLDFCDDGEGELLRRIRSLVGTKMPIAITLDPHANVGKQICGLADIIVSYKTYPHIDMRDIGKQAGEILQRTMAGEINPRTVRASRPMLEEINGGRTDIGPMIERIAAARKYEEQPDVFAVSVNGGFASADVRDVGPTVLVTGQGDFAAHTAFSETIADDIWNKRFDVLNDYLDVTEAAAIAASYEPDNGPLIIADYADNPGAGGYGDSTDLLRALLRAGVANGCFAPIVDGEAVQTLQEAVVGESVQIAIGGKTDPDFGGGPLVVDAELLFLSEGHFIGDGPMLHGLHGSFGPSAVIRVGGIEILVVTIPGQILDLQQFKAFNIDPLCKEVVALKSMQHFRAAFEPIAGQIIICDSGALCTPRYDRLPYRNVPRPIFPLDQFEI